MPIETRYNGPRKVMWVSLLIALIMILGATITAQSGMDGMNGGYALIMLLGFFAMSAVITAIVYYYRAKAFDKLVNDLKPLVHWKYTKEEWELFIQEDLKEILIINKSLLRLVIIISMVVLGFLLFTYRDALFILIIGCIILMLTFVAFIGPRIGANILKKGLPEAWIGESAALVGGRFQTWSQLGAYLVGVDIYTESPIPVLHIIFEFPTLQVTQQEIIRIPIPFNKMEEAKQVVGKLKKQIA